MHLLGSIKDPVKAAPHGGSLNSFFLKLIRDGRDLPFIWLTLKISFIMIPAGLLLFFPVPGWLWWLCAIAYTFMNNFIFKGPFGLMLHCTSHRPWFKKEYDIMNYYLPWVAGPFFGQTPETYFSHHLIMHHVENNEEEDISSTMGYQRDSFKDFMRYFANFFFLGLFQLIGYFNQKNLSKFRNKVLTGEIFFYLMCIVLLFINWQATLIVFILPYLISRLIMMIGNWTQHSFVDPEDPGNHYKNSITCINVRYNRRCWNDGYHISHHVRPGMHWTEHPQHLKENQDEYAKHKALVFDGLDFGQVWWYLMRGNYDKLSRHVVNINNTFNSKEEVVALMKARTAKI